MDVDLLWSIVTLRAVEKMYEALWRRRWVLGPLWGYQALDVVDVVPGMLARAQQAGGVEPQWVEVDDEGGRRQAILFLLASHGGGLSSMSDCC